jgi:hypothetical protein
VGVTIAALYPPPPLIQGPPFAVGGSISRSWRPQFPQGPQTNRQHRGRGQRNVATIHPQPRTRHKRSPRRSHVWTMRDAKVPLARPTGSERNTKRHVRPCPRKVFAGRLILIPGCVSAGTKTPSNQATDKCAAAWISPSSSAWTGRGMNRLFG